MLSCCCLVSVTCVFMLLSGQCDMCCHVVVMLLARVSCVVMLLPGDCVICCHVGVRSM